MEPPSELSLTMCSAQLCPGVPTILLACKSDPDAVLEVEAHVGDQIGQPYNVGLIEVTTTTSQGKHKMRTGLRWLLYRLEEKQRGWSCAPTFADSAGRSEEPDLGNTSTWQKGHHPAESRGSVSDHHSSSSSLGWMMDGEGATSTEGSAESEPAEAERGTNAIAAAAAVAAIPPSALASQSSLERGEAAKADSEIFVSLQELFNRLFTAIVSTESELYGLTCC